MVIEIDIEKNSKVYYACSKCNKWHAPGSNDWKEHLEYIDLDETNSDRPAYFWCTRHKKPHNLHRECIPYKAVITYRGKKATGCTRTIHKSHDDVLKEIKDFVHKKNKSKKDKNKSADWGIFRGTTNIPWPCNRATCQAKPDIIYCKHDSSIISSFSITHIIEYETATSAFNIVDKVKRFNISIKRMIEHGSQNEQIFPRIIFLYDPKTVINVNEVKKEVSELNHKYLDEVVVDYYDENGKWYDTYFKE